MTKKKSILVNENVVRRWGKLAAMPGLTENWLETLSEDDPSEEDAEAGADLEKADLGDDPAAELDYAEGDLERAEGGDAELAGAMESEEAQVLIQGIAQKVADMLGEPVEFEGGAEDEVEVEIEAGDDAELDLELEDEVPAMGADAYNREDITEGGMDAGDQGHEDFAGAKQSKSARKARAADSHKDGQSAGDQSKTKGKGGKGDFGKKASGNRKDETLDIDVVEDEKLTEAVLQRVIERLLSRK